MPSLILSIGGHYYYLNLLSAPLKTATTNLNITRTYSTIVTNTNFFFFQVRTYTPRAVINKVPHSTAVNLTVATLATKEVQKRHLAVFSVSLQVSTANCEMCIVSVSLRKV